jgi:RimJ/RimL family protein N-acetyltransferase
MTENNPYDGLHQTHQEQLLKMVAKGFYNELIKYGIRRKEVITVAGHLLDNVMQKSAGADKSGEYYNRLFTLADVRNDWAGQQTLALGDVLLRPLTATLLEKLSAWFQTPAVRNSFFPPYPEAPELLQGYFSQADRFYFQIEYGTETVGLIGAEHCDVQSGKLEMRKLVGDTRFRGKGIGKRATFLFLYYAFMIRSMNKVYIHSDDINVRNLNLNNHFGFELEGIFFEDVCRPDKKHDIVRMGLLHSR